MNAQLDCTQINSVMIVDDSDVQRRHATALCRDLGVTAIHAASNGREALAALSAMSRLPDLMIVDLEMPTMDGPQLLEQLQKHNINLPIIVASSRERELIELVQTMGKALGLRVIGALQKPLSSDSLRRTLRNAETVAVVAQSRAALSLNAKALENAIGNGEIRAYYQPKVDIRTGLVHGVEALARWQHPTLGLVPPGEFIPLAEKSELIHALTIQILSDAIAQTSAWDSHGIRLSLSVNLSPMLLEHSPLTDEITSLQQLHSLAANRLVLEVTESSVVSDRGAALGVLARLRLRGFGLSIDDYGTGFSSMQQLSRIPFTELKIDRSFVSGANERPNMQVILRSALEMARNLKMRTVAEGIENIEDWRLLQSFGCTLGQGYLIAKPMPGKELTAWLQSHHGRLPELRALDTMAEAE